MLFKAEERSLKEQALEGEWEGVRKGVRSEEEEKVRAFFAWGLARENFELFVNGAGKEFSNIINKAVEMEIVRWAELEKMVSLVGGRQLDCQSIEDLQ